MKSKFLTGAILFVAFAVTLQSNTTVATATGSVSITTTLGGDPIGEVLVGISTSEDNRENSEYIHEEETDANGKVVFSNLPAGTYYLDAGFSTEDEESYYAEAEVVVADGKVDVIFELEVEE